MSSCANIHQRIASEDHFSVDTDHDLEDSETASSQLEPMFAQRKVRWSSTTVFHDGCIGVMVRGLNFSHKASGESILNDVDLSIPRGKIFGLLGPSGCGKTTLLRCLVGFLKPSSGQIVLLDRPQRTKNLLIPGRNVGYMPQENALYEDMTISEILFYYGQICMMKSSDVSARIDELVEILHLPTKDRKISTMSGGQKRRVSFCIALLHCPPILILDEPTSGMDPLLRESIWLHLLDLSVKQNSTIIITTHYIEEARRSHLVGFMRSGRILLQETPSKLLKNFATLEANFLQLCRKNAQSERSPQESLCSTTYTFPTEFQPIKEDIGHTKFAHVYIWVKIFLALLARYVKTDLSDRSSLALQYMIPMMQTILVAACIGGQPHNISIGIVNDEHEPMVSSEIVSTLDPNILRVTNYTTMEEALWDVSNLKLWGVLRFKNDFSNSFQQRLTATDYTTDLEMERSTITLNIDNVDLIISSAMRRYLNRHITLISSKMLKVKDRASSGNMQKASWITNPVIQMIKPINEDAEHRGLRDFIFPGVVANLMFNSVAILLAMAVLNERLNQSFERNFVVGAKPYQMMLSLSISRTFLMTPLFFMITILPTFMFSFPTTIRRIFRTIPLIAVINFCGISYGMVVAVLCESIAMACIMCTGTLFATVFISGSLWPLEALHPYLRVAANLGPTTQATQALRNILYKDMKSLHPTALHSYTVLLAWTSVYFYVGIKYFRK